MYAGLVGGPAAWGLDGAVLRFGLGAGMPIRDAQPWQVPVQATWKPPARPAAEFGEYGICYVLYGKATTGSAPKSRSVLTVWSWVPEVREQWVTQFRPLLAPPASPALWPSERAARVGLQQLNSRFAAHRDALGLAGGLDFHSLRRSYVTHLIEDGWDARFVQGYLESWEGVPGRAARAPEGGGSAWWMRLSSAVRYADPRPWRRCARAARADARHGS
jgi:Phage integrase family